MEQSLSQQVALTAGQDFWNTRPVPGVPAMLLCDGPHGVRRQRSDRGFAATAVPATCFPTASALAASWDLELLHELGVALGAEARAQGVSVLLGPGANIKRSALCGRNFEYFSEDPHLSSRLAAAWIAGVQSTGVGASLKHFAANNQEYRRYTVDARIDERTLREIYLASFEYAVREARPATVMAAYNKLNGEHCTSNRGLLTTILREEWGFDGVVVSDWGATPDRAEAIAAGLDLDMPGYAGQGDDEVLARVHNGALPRAAVERAAANLARLAERTAGARAGGTYDEAAQHALARRAAAAGTVLLRNEQSLLPLPEQGTIGIFGAFAREPRYQGAGSSGVTPHRVDNLWDELAARTGGARLRYAPGYPRSDGRVDEALLREAAALASTVDIAVVMVGLPDPYEVEGADRTHLDLPPGHDALVERVAAANPRTVVVLANGAPVRLPWADRVGGIVEAYLGGQAGGGALAEVLLGLAEPGGRLAETFPYELGDNPVHTAPSDPSTVEYREGVFVGYRHYDRAGTAVAFPFGHGLSYTTFSWSAVRAEVRGDRVAVTLTVTNVGERTGSDVVQVYVHDVESTVERPPHELRGFAKVSLEPGRSAAVRIELDRRAFAVWDPGTHGWVVEGGEFELRVAASSRDVRATLRIDLDGDGVTPAPSPLPEASTAAGPYTVDTPMGDLDRPVPRLVLRLLTAIARRVVRDTPMAGTIDQLLAGTPPRMLPMVTDGRLKPGFARWLVRRANRGARR